MTIETITAYFTEYGAIAIFIIVFCEYLNLPGFPAGVIMPVSGIMARQGNINFIFVMIITTIAGLLGSLFLYGVGRLGGDVFMRFYNRKFPNSAKKLEENIEWLREKGYIGVFIAKLMPVIRTIISIPAGFLKLNLIKYSIWSTLGVFVWNLAFVGVGYLFGDKVFELLGKFLG